ncbi:MAG: metallophosphoesterase, partial [Bacteroidota bacterium]|nr:metallophosphoesterase [Bacteroidota bacterium]
VFFAMSMKRWVLLFFVYVLQWPLNAQVSHPPYRYVAPDSVETFVSDRYKAHSFLRYLLMGKNYRNVWEQRVVLPVFRLSQSGLKIEELGGGMQTKSLKLEDKNGQEWALRTLDKDVAGALSGFLEGTIAESVAQDQISASMPYSSLIIGPLAKSAGVRAASPTIYFVADDTAFGQYNSIFAGTICMLEARNAGFEDTDNTEDMLRKVMATNKYVVDQRSLLRARLLDMIIADWDRHFDNWRWGKHDSAGLRYYHAVPRDRDWAFYFSNGLVPKLARLIALRFMINFSEKLDYIQSVNYKGRRLDEIFLHGLSAADWQEMIRQLQRDLDDNAIAQAVHQLPPSIYALIGDSFIKKIKGRRNDLEKQAMKYYRSLARTVQIEGSGDNEWFTLMPSTDGFRLQIHQRLPNGEKGARLYDRTFVRAETYRVTLNGLGGDDRFTIDEDVRTAIRLQLNGGEGADTYELNGHVRANVFDNAGQNSFPSNKSGSKISFR